MRAKGSKAPRKQGVLRAKYDFIAAYELGYADVAFGKFNFACQKGDKRGCHQLGLLYVYAPEPKKIRIRLLRFLSKTATAGTPQAVLCYLGSMPAA